MKSIIDHHRFDHECLGVAANGQSLSELTHKCFIAQRMDLDVVEYNVASNAAALEAIEWDLSGTGRSEVWRYFVRSVCRSHAKCAMCGHVLKTPHAMTTSLKYHLRRTHAVVI